MRLLVLFLLTLTSGLAFSQKGSWQQELETRSSPEEKVGYLVEFAQNTTSEDARESALNRAKDLAEKSGVDSLQARVAYRLGLLEKKKGNNSASWKYYNKAKSLF